MKIKIGKKYTGDELEKLGYEMAMKQYILFSKDGKHSFLVIDLGNDNYEIERELK